MKNRQRYRAARDNLLDQLNLGFTYPLSDLPLEYDDVIPPGQRAKITLPFSQSTVAYRLHDQQGQPVKYADNSSAGFVSGNDSTLELGCPLQVETERYRIFAKKEGTKVGLALKQRPNPTITRSCYLNTIAEIKIGLNKELAVQISNGMLPGNAIQWQDFPVRLFNPGGVVNVTITDPQEEVYYRAVKLNVNGIDKEPFGNEVLGMGLSTQLMLETLPVNDDIDLHISATRREGEGDSATVEEVILSTLLQIKVRADSAIDYTITDADSSPAAGADYASTVMVGLANSGGTNIQYHLLSRTVLDQEFDFQARKQAHLPGFDSYLEENHLIATPIDDPLGTVYLKVPRAQQHATVPPQGYVPVAAPFVGNNAAHEESLTPFEEDQSLLLQVNKTHQVIPSGTGPLNNGTLPKSSFVSTIYADDVKCQLIRPNPQPGLELQLLDEAGLRLNLSGGQPGVLYTLEKIDADPAEIKKLFFHRWAVDHPNQQLGLGQWLVGYNFMPVSDAGGQSITTEWQQSLWSAKLKVTATKALTFTTATIASEITLPTKPEGAIILPFKIAF